MKLHDIFVKAHFPTGKIHDIFVATNLLVRKAIDTATGVVLTLLKSTGDDLVSLEVTGASTQASTPTPDAPVAIDNVGTLVTDGEHAGKYAVPVVCSDAAVAPTQTVRTVLYLDAPLRQGDTLEVVGGALVQRTGAYALTGAEEYVTASGQSEGNTFYASTTAIDALVKKNSTFSVCTRYEKRNVWSTDVAGYAILYFNTTNFLRLRTPKTTASSISGLKAWLAEQYTAGTPVQIQYLLAAPVSISLQGQTIPTFEGTTIVTVDTETQPSGMAATYWAKED